jgi:LPPG:FO 2-phospho-L-lactate transferase
MSVRVLLICGGLGGARLAPWLAKVSQLTVVVNVADDLEFMGLRVCPDVDSVLYALAGTFDAAKGYGLRDDSYEFRELSRAAGYETWFQVGDHDLQTHLLRTHLMREGLSLTSVTERLARAFGLTARVIPATDDHLRTRLDVEERDLSFQEFFVRDAGRSSPTAVRWVGAESAAPASGVLAAIEEADLVVLADSSPVASIIPILNLPGVREALVRRGHQRVALSPMVMALPPEDPLDRHHWSAREMLMRAMGLEHDPSAVAQLYAGLIDLFVLDRRDSALADGIARHGIAVKCADLLGRTQRCREELANSLIELAIQRSGSDARTT